MCMYAYEEWGEYCLHILVSLPHFKQYIIQELCAFDASNFVGTWYRRDIVNLAVSMMKTM